jgi:hypothetical protein
MICQASEVKLSKKNVPTFAIPTDAYKQFEALANSEGKSFSQAVRDAMHKYAKAQGIDINFNIGEWGGNRHGTKSDSNDKSN